MFFLYFMLFPTFLETKIMGIKKNWFFQIVDIGNFNMKLNGRWFPQIVDRDSGNLYQIYKIVVLASEPVGGRSRATELPCLSSYG